MAIQSNKRSSKLVVSKKRSGIFDAIASLDSQDNVASKRKQRSTEKDVRQSKAAQSQVEIYQRLMEVRILLQRVMTTGGEETSSTQQQELCQELLSQLMTARSTLTGAAESDSDDKEQEIDSSYQDLKQEWKTVLNRRYKDLRLHSGLTAKAQFKLLDSDFYHQVETTAQYQLVNAQKVAQQQDDDAPAVAVFDDSKLYQHQLQDFLSLDNKKSNSDNVLDTKKSRRQNKKNTSVDRKASKGRKIRYHVYPKIVNFTFPLQRPAASGNTTMDQDEWFKSLFGGGTKSITQN
jgi:hypothetical protein